MADNFIFKIVLWFSLSVTLCFGAECTDPDKTDPEETDPIFADFCFYRDVGVFTKPDTGFVLTYYEMLDEVSFTIESRNIKTNTYFEVSLADVDWEKVKINPFRGMTGSVGNGYGRHSFSVSPYDLIDFYFDEVDSLYVYSLFETTRLLKWKYRLDFGRQKQTFSGENFIYISGLCSKEQLKTIKKRKKAASKEIILNSKK